MTSAAHFTAKLGLSLLSAVPLHQRISLLFENYGHNFSSRDSSKHRIANIDSA